MKITRKMFVFLTAGLSLILFSATNSMDDSTKTRFAKDDRWGNVYSYQDEFSKRMVEVVYNSSKPKIIVTIKKIACDPSALNLEWDRETGKKTYRPYRNGKLLVSQSLSQQQDLDAQLAEFTKTSFYTKDDDRIFGTSSDKT